MGPFTGTAFGVGTPIGYPGLPSTLGWNPYAGQSLGAQPSPQQMYGAPFAPPLQQLVQLLQIVPQQLQQIQFVQQQQLQQLQHLLQILPAQIHQLQQLVQVVPQQVQQLQQWQQQPFSAAGAGTLGFGLVPQTFAGQASGHVM